VYDSVPSELIPVIDVEENGNNFRNTSNLNDKLEQLISLFEQEYGQKPIIYLGSFCCWKVIHTVYNSPIWLRFLKVYHIIPNTAIKQTAVIDNLDRNYCKDIDAIVLKK
jgi:GH25 family lysozyme M1 (1,4-beta-N-acetylmuramidase)